MVKNLLSNTIFPYSLDKIAAKRLDDMARIWGFSRKTNVQWVYIHHLKHGRSVNLYKNVDGTIRAQVDDVVGNGYVLAAKNDK